MRRHVCVAEHAIPYYLLDALYVQFLTQWPLSMETEIW
jgi:hypothetical protein